MNADRVATTNCGGVDRNLITLSTTHAGHSNDTLALPAGYLSVLQNSHEVWVQKTVCCDSGDSAA